MRRITHERDEMVIHLDCEVCAKQTDVPVPRQRAPYGIVDCPGCGATYMVSLGGKGATLPSSAQGEAT